MWTDELFHVKKPIIALLHLRALPGDPLYEKDATMGEVIKNAARELQALQEGGQYKRLSETLFREQKRRI